MLNKLLAIGALIVITTTTFIVQSMTGTAYAAFAQAGNCYTTCATAGAFGDFAFAFAKAWGTIAAAFAG